MRKYYLILVACLSAPVCFAQEDVTQAYLQNASFEDDDISNLTAVRNSADGLRGYILEQPSGWTVGGSAVTRLLVTEDCYTDNNFGKVTTLADGNSAYYLRMGWSTGTTILQQQIASLPKGKYQLTARMRSAYANSATSAYQLFAGDAQTSGSFAQGTGGYFVTAPWQTISLTFDTAEEAPLNIGVRVNWMSGGSCVMVDDVRLQRLPNDTPLPEEPTEADVPSLTEDVITSAFVGEGQMKDDLLQMLANFSAYLKNDFLEAQYPNSVGELCGCFQSNSTMQNNEDGVRSNADLSMIAAFLSKYGRNKVTLPAGVTWADIEQMAMKSLVFAYSTHKANKLKVCQGGNYWGSTGTNDFQWESSLWAMSVAYSAFFQWDRLTDQQRGYIYALLKAECNYELNRSVPTGYAGDTKAEENGWEADVLAATLGLFPDDELAPQWFDRLRLFAINSYSHSSDKDNHTVIDPDYDDTTVAQLYRGQNLYDDYTLQNHNYFHTSYQNVVIQELGEAALALKLFQTQLHGTERWKTNALMHNNLQVQQQVLNWLALADGELAMPNGNDWSLFLYDQITSYTTNATFLRDPDALMLENLAYKMIQARQKTTDDGSWLLRSDIGARRMGVEGHRVMMTWLMHDMSTTADLQPSVFDEFRARHAEAKIFKTQNIVRAYTPDRFTTFSWSAGLGSYTGYIAANSVDKNKIIVPYKKNNTGNFLGWYTVAGKQTNATPAVNGIYQLQGDSYVMNGELATNDASLNHRFAIYSTPGNAVIYLDHVQANTGATITGEQGGLMAISTDELTRTSRTLYYDATHKQTDGATLHRFKSPWVNIDNALGIVAHNAKEMAFGDRANNNSIMTTNLYASYSTESRAVQQGETVDARNMTYYSNLSAAATEGLSRALVNLKEQLPEGWNGVMAADPDSTRYLFLSNFASAEKAVVEGLTTTLGAPVFFQSTTSTGKALGRTTFTVEQNHSLVSPARFFVDSRGVTAVQDSSLTAIYLRNNIKGENPVTVIAVGKSGLVTKSFPLTSVAKVTLEDDELVVEEAPFPEEPADTLTTGYTDETTVFLQNPNFEEDNTYGVTGSATAAGITYTDCYLNDVPATDSRWPNVLPIVGWTPSATLSGGSNYCRRFSMPYSTTKYCVSPSTVGNFATRTVQMLADETCGRRTLTVLNSWDRGDNAIRQTVMLPAGTYRVLLDMKYECPNESANDGVTIVTPAAVNTSLTGVLRAGVADYRYPSARNEWQTMVYDFTLDREEAVTLSLGYAVSAGVGAANNTTLYIDNVRLLKKIATGIADIHAVERPASDAIYNLQGIRQQQLQPGVNIVKGKKIIR